MEALRGVDLDADIFLNALGARNGIKRLAACLFIVFVANLLRNAWAWARTAYILQTQFPSPPLVSWVPGHAPIFATTQPHRVWADWSERLGGDFYARLGPVHVLFISNPITASLLHSRSLYPHIIDRGVEEQMKHFNAICTDSNTSNLISCHTTKHWRIVRRGLAPAFGPDSLRKGFPFIIQSAERLSAALMESNGAVLDMDAALQRTMLDVLSGVGFCGYNLCEATGLDALNLMDLLSDTIELGGKEVCKRMANPVRPFMFWDKSMWEAERKMTQFKRAMRHLLSEMKARAPFPDDDSSIIAHLFRIHDENGQPLSDNELHSQMSAIFFGGTDSTTHTMAYTLAFIAEHEDVRNKVLEELDMNGLLVTENRPRPRPVTYNDALKLSFLAATIKESMRMVPVIPLTARKAHKDIILPDGRLVPKGTAFILNSAAMHNHEGYYPNAAHFKPERWLEKGGEHLTIDDNGRTATYRRFIPFGEGMRSCLGQNLATIAMRSILAHVLGRFDLKLSSQMPTMDALRQHEYLGSAVYPHGGLPMQVFPR